MSKAAGRKVPERSRKFPEPGWNPNERARPRPAERRGGSRGFRFPGSIGNGSGNLQPQSSCRCEELIRQVFGGEHVMVLEEQGR
jgi:hypothetical protein